jgi:hypothetical protein
MVLLAVGAGDSTAQDKGGPLERAVIERSREIQAALARIEAGKEAFVDELIASWVPALDPGIYDPWNEIKPLAMKATPWHLYGASLVGDFGTMVRLLGGKAGAGRYMSALSRPQPRLAPGPAALGDGTDSLVFTPIVPCRMVDTRGAGARTGVLAVGTPRSFDLTTDGYAKGQGGATSGCTGLPGFSHHGWAVNITATGFTALGNLTVYPSGGTKPLASVLNYSPVLSAVANAASVAGCLGCDDDVTVAANASASHVVIDVMGYYQQATGFVTGTESVTYLAGTPVTIAPGGTAFVYGGSCPAGTVLTGGGMTNSLFGASVVASDHFVTGSLWYEYVRNGAGQAADVTVYSACKDIT